jgi:hypothetical protein
MAIPQQQLQSSVISAPLARPESAATIDGPVKAPFRMKFDPQRVELVDLTNAPKGAMEKMGLKPGHYWLPQAYEMPGTAGVNGVFTDAGWTTEQMLVDGWPQPTAEEVAAGVRILDAWHEVPGEFCPPGVPAGSVLRRIPVRGGLHYHSPFGGLKVVDPRAPAEPVYHKAHAGAWVASLVLAGVAPSASEHTVNQQIADIVRTANNVAAKPYQDAGMKAAAIKTAQDRATIAQNATVLHAHRN